LGKNHSAHQESKESEEKKKALSLEKGLEPVPLKSPNPSANASEPRQSSQKPSQQSPERNSKEQSKQTNASEGPLLKLLQQRSKLTPKSGASGQDGEWTSCCGCRRVTPQAVKYGVQVAFACFTIFFAASMVTYDQMRGLDPEPLWISLLTSTVTLFLPNPAPQ
jgi:hypothetical protein